MIDIRTLRLILRYAPDTGKLYWLERPENMFSAAKWAARWNGRWAGVEALTASDSKGYLQGLIFGKTNKAHRVGWAIHTGSWPAQQIDHRNGIRHDNRFLNLREATGSQNCMNRRSRSLSSRFLGVHWHAGCAKWRAQIKLSGRNTSLGLFVSEEEAARAYDAAARAQFGQFAKPNLPAGDVNENL